MSGLSEEVVKEWMVQKDEWMKICDLRTPAPEILTDLINKWPSFRQVTLELASENSILTQHGVHQQDALACRNNLVKFFGVPDHLRLPVKRNLIAFLKKPLEVENYAPSMLKAELFNADFKGVVLHAESRIRQQVFDLAREQ